MALIASPYRPLLEPATRSPYDPRVPSSRAREAGFLREIISTVASTLELDEVLGHVVRLLTDASAVHAGFVYLLDETGDRLVLAAASAPYDGLVGSIALERGEGLAWWVVERGEPAFVPDNLLDDPRVKYVPELEEERFQSLLAVPIVSRRGPPIGAILAHTEAPREFSADEVEVIVSTAALVAGAIENARLYEETSGRVRELLGLTGLAEAIAAAESLDELLPAVASGARSLLAASSAHLYLLDQASEELSLAASSPRGSRARERVGLDELGREVRRRNRGTRLSVPLVAGDELLGLLVAEETSALELARAAANQAAVGIKKVQLIARLTEENLIKDFFRELERGSRGPELEGRAAGLGLELDRPHVVLVAEPADDAFERALLAVAPGSLLDRRERSVRALVRVPAHGHERLLAELRRVHGEVPTSLAVGVSSVCQGLPSLADGFAEARQAVAGAAVVGGSSPVVSYEDLGAYKYLLRIARDATVRDATVDAVARLAEYDSQRGASLVQTLEEFLRRRGSVSATSEALFVHPNTLRQRLRRIADVSGLDLRTDDWLMVEIAVKLVRLRRVLEPGDPDTSTS
jgi:GAF domain-containing protein